MVHQMVTTCEAAYDYVDGGNCGQGLEIVSAEECKAAADALGMTKFKKESMSGKWKFTPPGCFVHKGCMQGCRLHFGLAMGTTMEDGNSGPRDEDCLHGSLVP